MYASDYLENVIVDHLFRSRTWSKPAVLWIGLLTSAPTDGGGGTELSGGSPVYVRRNFTPNDAVFLSTQGTNTGNSTGTSGRTSLVPGTSVNWDVPRPCTITHVGVYDAGSGGNLLFWAPLAAPLTVVPGDPRPTIADSDFAFTVF